MNQYIDQLCSMVMNKSGGHTSPHKAVMMLAVIDLVRSGDTSGNLIEYGPELLERFKHYFAEHQDTLIRLTEQEEGVGLYAQVLRGQREKTECIKEENETVRDIAFARVVKRAYHYQCAACGLRIYFDDVSLVDAAHIVPLHISNDNDPCNGMALCKNHRWAMDQELIAPCSNYKWKAHPDLDERSDSHRHLIGLNGKKIILPEEKRFMPKAESLQWREKKLKFA